MKQKGITLLALIVTVIILLILVGVTIGQITGNEGLFNRVRKTVAQYENAQEKEDSGMSELETMLAEERENQEELESTTAEPEDVLKEKTFYTGEKELLEGTMENNGAVTERIEAGKSYTIPKGYHNGLGTVTAKTLAEQTLGNATSDQILNGYSAWVKGNKIDGNMPNNPPEEIELKGGEEYTIPKGYHDGTGKIKVAKSLQLVELKYPIPQVDLSFLNSLVATMDLGLPCRAIMITGFTVMGGNKGAIVNSSVSIRIQGSNSADSGYVEIGATETVTRGAYSNSTYIVNNATINLSPTQDYRYYKLVLTSTDNDFFHIYSGTLTYSVEVES